MTPVASEGTTDVTPAARAERRRTGSALAELLPGGPTIETFVAEGEEAVERAVRGNVTVEAGEVVGGTGSLDQSEVTRMSRVYRRLLFRCYGIALNRNPTLSGRITVRFTVEPQGNVSIVRATQNTTGDAFLADCATDAMRRLPWASGPEGGSLELAYAIGFTPETE